jgi:hypothetical protein
VGDRRRRHPLPRPAALPSHGRPGGAGTQPLLGSLPRRGGRPGTRPVPPQAVHGRHDRRLQPRVHDPQVLPQGAPLLARRQADPGRHHPARQGPAEAGDPLLGGEDRRRVRGGQPRAGRPPPQPGPRARRGRAQGDPVAGPGRGRRARHRRAQARRGDHPRPRGRRPRPPAALRGGLHPLAGRLRRGADPHRAPGGLPQPVVRGHLRRDRGDRRRPLAAGLEDQQGRLRVDRAAVRRLRRGRVLPTTTARSSPSPRWSASASSTSPRPGPRCGPSRTATPPGSAGGTCSGSPRRSPPSTTSSRTPWRRPRRTEQQRDRPRASTPDSPARSPVQIDPTGGRLVAWARGRRRRAPARHSRCPRPRSCPKAFQGNAGDATAAIMLGDELGLKPLAALRSIYIISGTPAMYARTMVALVMSHGHEVWTESSTDREVVVCGRRRGSEHVERSAWTIDRARKAGYTNNKKYESDPQAMLYARRPARSPARSPPTSSRASRTPSKTWSWSPRTSRRRRSPAPRSSAPGPPPPSPSSTSPSSPPRSPSRPRRNAARRGSPTASEEAPRPAQGMRHHRPRRGPGLHRRHHRPRDRVTKELSKAEASKAIDQIETEKEGGAAQ